MATVRVIEGDLLDQQVEVIVNAWNRNPLPWWLLLPQGVSRAIRRKAGIKPFQELARMKMVPLGGAVETTPGKLPYKAIIHVAGINLLWRTSQYAIRQAVRNALQIATQKKYASIAFPLIGAGTGGFEADKVLRIMIEEAEKANYSGEISIVRFKA